MNHTSTRTAEAALTRAVAFLEQQQLPNGEFPAYVARDEALQQERRLDSTPFVTTYVLYSLGFVSEPGVREMIDKGLDFVAGEMQVPGVWRYWSTHHEHHRHTPPDLDDTCCSAFVLRHFGRPVPDLANLLLANRDPAGRFYTWLVPRFQPTVYLPYWRVTLREALRLPVLLAFWRLTEAAPDDVDGVVNANVLLYLGACPEAKAVVDYLQQELEAGREASCDKWHLNACSFYYAVSRAYFNGTAGLARLREGIVRRLTARQEAGGAFGNPSETAMGAAALLNLGERGTVLEQAVQHLVYTQHPNGSWQAHALYFGGPKRYYGWGSEALTTALCVEVLARYATT